MATKNEKLLALLALRGVSDDEINAFLALPPTPPPRGCAPGPGIHPYSWSRSEPPPRDTVQSAHEPRRSPTHGVSNPCYPRPATMEPRQPAEAGRSTAYMLPTMPDPVRNQSQYPNQNWNPDQSPPPRACSPIFTRSIPSPATCPKTVPYTPPSPSYPYEETRTIETSRCGPSLGGGCGPQAVPCRQETARTATCAQRQSCNRTPQQPASTAPLGLSGQMVTSCDAAASIIAEIYRHGDMAAARASLACGTEGPCFISNLDLLELLERHG